MDDLACDCDTTFGDIAVLVLIQLGVIVGIVGGALAWVMFGRE